MTKILLPIFNLVLINSINAQILTEFNFPPVHGGYTNSTIIFYENVKMNNDGQFDFSKSSEALVNKLEYNNSGYVTKMTSSETDDLLGRSSVFNSIILIDTDKDKINRVELFTYRDNKKPDLLREHRAEYDKDRLIREYVYGKNNDFRGTTSYVYGITQAGNDYYKIEINDDNNNQCTYSEKDKFGEIRTIKIYNNDTISESKLVSRSDDNTYRKFLMTSPSQYGMARDFIAMIKDTISVNDEESTIEGTIDSFYLIYREILDENKNPTQSVISVSPVGNMASKSNEFVMSASKTEYSKVEKVIQSPPMAKQIIGVWKCGGAGLELVIEDFEDKKGKHGIWFHYMGNRTNKNPGPILQKHKWIEPLKEIFTADYTYNDKNGILTLTKIQGVNMGFKGDFNFKVKIEDDMLLLSPTYDQGESLRFLREF